MSVEKWSDSIAVVHLANDPQFTDELQDLDRYTSEHSRPHTVLDFTGVDTINSSNLARLLKIRKQGLQSGRRVLFCNVGLHVLNTLLITGLDNVFEISQDVSTALATLKMAEGR